MSFLSVWMSSSVPVKFTYFIAAFLACTPRSRHFLPPLLQRAFWTFSHLKRLLLCLLSCLPLSSFSLKPALGFYSSIDFFSSPPLLWLPCLAPTGYSWVRSICGQRSSQPERWAERAKPALSHSLRLSVRRKPEIGVLFPLSRPLTFTLWHVSRPSPVLTCVTLDLQSLKLDFKQTTHEYD